MDRFQPPTGNQNTSTCTRVPPGGALEEHKLLQWGCVRGGGCVHAVTFLLPLDASAQFTRHRNLSRGDPSLQRVLVGFPQGHSG